jgi:hypothetical protein
LAEDNGFLHFYEYTEPREDEYIAKTDQNYQPSFNLVRTWRCSKVMHNPTEINNSQSPYSSLLLTSIDILDGNKEQCILTATFNNRSIYTINLFDQIYSSDKKDDLKLKQVEHKKVIDEITRQDPRKRTPEDLENDRNYLL